MSYVHRNRLTYVKLPIFASLSIRAISYPDHCPVDSFKNESSPEYNPMVMCWPLKSVAGSSPAWISSQTNLLQAPVARSRSPAIKESFIFLYWYFVLKYRVVVPVVGKGVGGRLYYVDQDLKMGGGGWQRKGRKHIGMDFLSEHPLNSPPRAKLRGFVFCFLFDCFVLFMTCLSF